MATQSNILAWELPLIEEPGGLHEVQHDFYFTHLELAPV